MYVLIDINKKNFLKGMEINLIKGLEKVFVNFATSLLRINLNTS